MKPLGQNFCGSEQSLYRADAESRTGVARRRQGVGRCRRAVATLCTAIGRPARGPGADEIRERAVWRPPPTRGIP